MNARALHTFLRVILAALACTRVPAHADGGIVVIAHAGVPGIDSTTLEKIYTGRVIEVNGVFVTPVNASAGSDAKSRFLHAYLHEDEDKYTAYWVVRRYIGKGASPREFSSSAEIIKFVNATPGAVGYINEADLQPGINVLLR